MIDKNQPVNVTSKHKESVFNGMPNRTSKHYSYRKRMLCLHCSVNSMLTSMFPVGSLMDRKKKSNSEKWTVIHALWGYSYYREKKDQVV